MEGLCLRSAIWQEAGTWVSKALMATDRRGACHRLVMADSLEEEGSSGRRDG